MGTGTAKAAEIPEWIPKIQAAKILGISVRQLERREQQGYLEKRATERGPNQRTAPVLYSRADILALKAGKPNVHARPVAEAPTNDTGNIPVPAVPPPTAGAGAIARRADPMFALAAHLAQLSTLYPPPATAVKPWLGLKEAAAYSGLPAAYLKREARAGADFARNVGNSDRPIYRYSSELLKGTR